MNNPIPHPPEFDPSKCLELEDMINGFPRPDRPSKGDSNKGIATSLSIHKDYSREERRIQAFYKSRF